MQQNNTQQNEIKKEHGAYIYALAVAVLICLQLAAAVIAAVIWRDSLLEESANLPPEFLLFASFLLQAAFTALYFLFYRKRRIKPTHRLKTKLHPAWYALSALLGIACLFLFMGAHTLFDNFLRWAGYTAPDSPFADPSGFLQKSLIILTAVIAAPIGEELIFRGGLIDGLDKKYPVFVTAVLSGVLFSFMHMSPAQTIYQFFLGFAAACLVLRTKSVLPGIILHMVSNLIVALSLMINPVEAFFTAYTQQFIFRSFAGGLVLSILLAAIGTAVFSGLVLINVKSKKPQNGEQAINIESTTAKNTLFPAERKNNRVFYACLIAPFLVTLFVWIGAFLV